MLRANAVGDKGAAALIAACSARAGELSVDLDDNAALSAALARRHLAESWGDVAAMHARTISFDGASAFEELGARFPHARVGATQIAVRPRGVLHASDAGVGDELVRDDFEHGFWVSKSRPTGELARACNQHLGLTLKSQTAKF